MSVVTAAVPRGRTRIYLGAAIAAAALVFVGVSRSFYLAGIVESV